VVARSLAPADWRFDALRGAAAFAGEPFFATAAGGAAGAATATTGREGDDAARLVFGAAARAVFVALTLALLADAVVALADLADLIGFVAFARAVLFLALFTLFTLFTFFAALDGAAFFAAFPVFVDFDIDAALPDLRVAGAVFLRPAARDDAEAPFAREAFAALVFAGLRAAVVALRAAFVRAFFRFAIRLASNETSEPLRSRSSLTVSLKCRSIYRLAQS
jgi:hypothetical protein